MIWNVVMFLAGMAAVEGFIKPLVVSHSRRLAIKYLPPLFDRLDPFMPDFIRDMNSEQLREKIFYELFDIEPHISEREAKKVVEEYIKQYNPIINADKVGVVKDGK